MTDLHGIKLHASWALSPLSDVAEINPKLDKADFANSLEVSFVPMPAVEAETGEINVTETRSFAEVKKGYTTFREGDVLFAKITPGMENGKMAVVPKVSNGLAFGSTEFHVLRARNGISAHYIYYFVSSQRFRYDAEHNMTGAVGQRRVPTSYLTDHLIPIPPSDAQIRIVTKIEELLSELDKGTESLRTAREQLKVYRQAVLKHAFEGKLTTAWRKNNNDKLKTTEALLAGIRSEREVHSARSLKRRASKPFSDFSSNEQERLPELPFGWAWAKVGYLFEVVSGATPKGIEGVGGGAIPYYKVSDMNTPGNETKMNVAVLNLTELERGDLGLTSYPAGTVIFPKRGGAILTNKKRMLSRPSCFDLNTMGVFNTLPSLSCDYLWQWFQKLDLSAIYDGSNVPQINNKNVEPLPFPFCSIEEQREIVKLLEEKLSIVDRLEEDIELELKMAEALRQSILIKAFSGKLVAQDPNDEPASVLLERIRAAKINKEKNKTKVREKDAA